MSYIIQTIKEFMRTLKKNDVAAHSAQAAYFIILSFIPFVMLLMTLVQYTPITKTDIIKSITYICPESFRPMMLSILNEIYEKSSAVISITAITALWSAGRGVTSLSTGLNSIYQVDETRNFILIRIRSILYTVLFIAAIILSLVLLVFGNRIHVVLLEYAPFIAGITAFLMQIRTVVSLVIFTIVFLFIYRFLPNRKSKFKQQLPGAIIAAGAWIVFSFGFSLYVDSIGNNPYSYGQSSTDIYETLTTIILVMLWLYFCMYILLIGAVINVHFEDRFQTLREVAATRIQEKKEERNQSRLEKMNELKRKIRDKRK